MIPFSGFWRGQGPKVPEELQSLSKRSVLTAEYGASAGKPHCTEHILTPGALYGCAVA